MRLFASVVRVLWLQVNLESVDFTLLDSTSNQTDSKEVDACFDKVTEQGNKVRQLKSAKAAKVS